MIRRLFTVASLISLGLCLGTAAIWARSYGVRNAWIHRDVRYRPIHNGVTDPHDPEFHLVEAIIVERTVDVNSGRVLIAVKRSIPDLQLAPANMPDWQGLYPQGVHDLWTRGEAYSDFDDEAGILDGQIVLNRGGFRFDTYSIRGISSFTQFTVSEYGFPIWVLCLATAMLPAVRLTTWFRHRLRRRRSGHCPICGYDLRASTDRCPECGTPIAQKTEVSA